VSDVNKQLNALEVHRDKKCPDCGRQWPKTVLNIEGMIHHRVAAKCIDRKSCQRLKRRGWKQ